jgi:maltodextrin utilization protein YvdJ
MAEMASFKEVPAVSAFFSAMALPTFLCRVFSIFLTDLFFKVLASVCRALLMADIFFFGRACAGNVTPPYDYDFQSF